MSSILLLLVVSYGVMRSSRVQTYLVQRVAAFLSEELQTQVTVGGLDISFFLNIVLEDVAVLDRHQQSMIYTRRMVFDIEKISFRQRYLSINKLFLEQAFVGLARYQDQEDYNFRFLVEYFARDKSDTIRGRSWDVICKSFEFQNSAFHLTDNNFQNKNPGFDPGNFSITGFNMEINDIFLDNDTLGFELEHLSFKNNAGEFHLDYLSGVFKVAPEQTQVNDLKIASASSSVSVDLHMEYNGYQAFADFINEVDLDLLINESHIDLFDLGYFLPGIYGMEGRLDLLGNITGTISNLRANNLLLLFGRATMFKGGFHLNGLPDIDETFINFYVNEFSSDIRDIQSLKLPNWSTNPHPVLPQGFSALGRMFFKGRLTGFVNDFMAYGQLSTDIGRASSDIQFRREKGEGVASYKGNLETTNFDLGAFFDNHELLGEVSFKASVEGQGFSLETIEMDFSGEVENLSFVNYNYQDLHIAGQFNNRKFRGDLTVKDDNLQFDFNGLVSFEQQIPVFDFNAIIVHANLSELNIFQRDSLYYSCISGELDIKASGSSLDDMLGELKAHDLTYYEISIDNAEEFRYFTDDISLVNRQIDNIHNQIFFRSSFLDADLHGTMSFHRLGSSFMGFASSFLPAVFSPRPHSNGSSNQDFVFDLLFKDTRVLSELFMPSLGVSHGSHFNGAFDSQNKVLFFSGNADELVLAGNRMINWEVTGSHKDEIFNLVMESNRLIFSDSLFIEQFRLDAGILNDSVFFEGLWDNFDTSIRNHGKFQGIAHFKENNIAKLQFLPSYAFVNDSLWMVGPANEITFAPGRTEVVDLLLYKNEESLNVHGILGDNPDEFLHFTFDNFNVDNFDFIFQEKNLEFAGIINGDISLAGFRKAPNINAALNIKDFGFNRDHLGDLVVNSSWDNEKKGFYVDAKVIYYGNVGQNIPLSAWGYFYPERRDNNFDLDIRLENLKMSIFARYLDGFAQNFRGMASGNMRLDGPIRSPELSGSARLVRTGFRVDYLNTSYTFAHEVEVAKNYFRFNNLVLNDTLGQNAMINGSVYHSNFKNFSLDILIQPERMVVLNTTAAHNDLYYGRAFVSGFAHIHGPAHDIIMDISGRTNRGTQIFLPLDYSGELVETSFINFITRDTTFVATPFAAPEISGITLNFDLEVTPEAEVQLIFDSQIGDIIRGRGTGNLKFEITSLGAFNMYGDYVIEEGDYLFTLQNLINKRFRIEQGGSIRWAGDPYDADIDLRAAYRLRTPLYDLMMDIDTSGVYRRRVPVETILELKDKLFNPTITFDINLPGSDEATRDLIERLITTEQEMNRQVFSLLVLNRFMPTTSDQYNTALGYGVGSTSSELLSNQLSNWLSQISSDFDIGINYRPGDEISSQELEVALSTQFFDDRVTIDGNVGVAGNNPATNQRTSTLIGDVVVEVKITPEGKFRIKAFNRSNTFDVINTNSPYSQGVGVFYRKEFDNIGELWRRTRRVAPAPEFSGEEE